MNTALFDLDGTLMPTDEETFVKVYFGELCKKLVPMGFDADALVNAIWTGTKAMVLNDGTHTNQDVFWAKFAELMDCDIEKTREACDSFYANEFDSVKRIVGPAPLTPLLISGLREKGYMLVLATNPVFPRVAVETRLGWVGLKASDFSYITSYENSHFCKPNLKYYDEILVAIGREANDCLMVGNNVGEDMCFRELGGEVFLLTDHIENPQKLSMDGIKQGSAGELKAYLDSLASV